MLLKGIDTKKVLTFGELLIRFCPDEEGSWLQQNQLPFYVGGSEANVAAALALWQVPVSYISRVPDNLVGQQLAQYLFQKGIDISKMTFGGNRLGLYFLPKGKDLKNATVIYDRSHSSFSELTPGMIDWDQALNDVGWLHFSAISPGIAKNTAAVCKEAAAAAAAKGVVVSLDLNYRAKLWKWGQEPVEVMPELASHCDVLMGNIWAAEKMLGCSLNASALKDKIKEACLEQAAGVSKNIIDRFPNVKAVANTFRFDQQPGALHYYATLFSGENSYISPEFEVEKVVDNVGTGDCFMAGLIYGFYNQLSLQQTIDFAAAAAVRKLAQPGDMTTSTVSEIQNSIKAHAR